MTLTAQNLTATVNAGQTARLRVGGVASSMCRSLLTVTFDLERSFIRFNQRAAIEQVFFTGLTGSQSGSHVPTASRFLLFIGHTDQRGDASLNDALSLRRAKAVRAVFIDEPEASRVWEDIYQAEHWNGPNFELAQMSAIVDAGGSSSTSGHYVNDAAARLDLFRRYLAALRPDWLAQGPRSVSPAFVSTPRDAVLGCGQNHPARNAPGTTLEENRRVEFFFFTTRTPSFTTCAGYPSQQLSCGQFISIVIELTDECGHPYSGPFDLRLPNRTVLRNQRANAQGRYTRDNVTPGRFTVTVDSWSASNNLTANHNTFPTQLLRPITRSGSALHRGGQNFRFFGTNAYYLLDWAGTNRTADVERFFRFVKNAGIYVVRTWGFNERQIPSNNSRTMVDPLPGGIPLINPAGLSSLATVVDLAERHHIYLIIALSNYNPDYGGICQYARWAVQTPANFTTTHPEGSNPDHLVEELFYTGTIQSTSTSPPTNFTFNFNPRDLYWDYACHVINLFQHRTNILAWELMNEPRVKAEGASTRQTVLEFHLREWIGTTAHTIRQRCPHLSSPLQSNQKAPFISMGGGDINRIAFLFTSTNPAERSVPRQIDLVDTHLYPQDIGLDERDAAARLDTAIRTAHSHSKPFYLGEFGIAQDRPPLRPPSSPPPQLRPDQLLRRTNRINEYRDWARTLQGNSDVAGMLFWQLLPSFREAYDPFEVNVDLVALPRVGPLQNVAPPGGGNFPTPSDGSAIVDFVNAQLQPSSAGGWSVC